MEKNRMELRNRYGASIWLEPAGQGSYKLCGELDGMRILGDPGDIVAIDPVGGPMLGIGDLLNGRRITAIIYDRYSSISNNRQRSFADWQSIELVVIPFNEPKP